MTWILAIIISIFATAFASIFQRKMMQDVDRNPLVYATFTQFASGLIILILSLVIGIFVLPSFTVIAENKLYFFILLSGICYAVNAFAGFKALQDVEVSKFIILYSSKSIVTIVLSTLFLGEVLGTLQLLGIGLILFSIVVINYKSLNTLLSFGKGELFVLLGAFAIGVATVSDKYLLNWFEFMPYLVIDFFLPATILFLSKPKMIKQFPQFLDRKNFLKVSVYLLLFVTATLTFFYALVSADNASLVTSVGQVVSVVTVVLGIVILKERDNLGRKLIAGALSFLGLLLLTV